MGLCSCLCVWGLAGNIRPRPSISLSLAVLLSSAFNTKTSRCSANQGGAWTSLMCGDITWPFKQWTTEFKCPDERKSRKKKKKNVFVQQYDSWPTLETLWQWHSLAHLITRHVVFVFLKEALWLWRTAGYKSSFLLKVEGEKNMLSERPTILAIVLLVCYINVHKCTVYRCTATMFGDDLRILGSKEQVWSRSIGNFDIS